MNNQTQKHSIKIPKDTLVIYHEKKQTLTLIGPLKQKSIKLKLKIFISKLKKTIIVRSVAFSSMSNNVKKNIKALRNTTVRLIQHLLIETSTLIYKKLEIHGVGYRTLFTESFNQKLITLKLGYSHSVYFKIPKHLIITCSTKTKLCVFGNSYQNVSQAAARIRSKKPPEPYKGKGFLYENEKIVLKEGKKV